MLEMLAVANALLRAAWICCTETPSEEARSRLIFTVTCGRAIARSLVTFESSGGVWGLPSFWETHSFSGVGPAACPEYAYGLREIRPPMRMGGRFWTNALMPMMFCS